MTIPQVIDAPASATRRMWWLLAVMFVGVAAACGIAYYNYQKTREPYREAELLTKVIWRLGHHQPSDIYLCQWSAAVSSTYFLHRDSKTHLAPVESTRTLRLEIERKLDGVDGPIDMETIYWIWDSYSKLFHEGGRLQHHRTHMSQQIQRCDELSTLEQMYGG